MRKLCIILIAFSSVAQIYSQKNLISSIREKNYVAYLFAYFRGNNIDEEQVCYAVSKDAYNYYTLNDNKPVIDSKLISETGGVRDPHILRKEDGKSFYMVVTDMTSNKGWDSNRGMVLLKSDDLINWTSSKINMQKKYAKQEDLLRVWAPQTIYDPYLDKYMIYWSMKHGSGPDIIYYAYANKDFTDLEGNPNQLFFPKDGKSCIDADIILKNGLFYMFYKTEDHGNGIKRAVTDNLTSGCWLEQSDYKQQTQESVEGSCVFKIINEDKYILLYDVYLKREYHFCESVDLDCFKMVKSKISMNFQPRHGTIIPITQDELDRLISKWSISSDFNKMHENNYVPYK